MSRYFPVLFQFFTWAAAICYYEVLTTVYIHLHVLKYFFLPTAMMPYWNTFWRGLEVTFIFVWGQKTLEWSFSTYTYILENILLQKLLPKMQTLLVVWSIQEESRKALLHLHIRCCVGLGTSRVIRSPCKSTCDHSRVFSHRSKTNVTSSPLQNVFQYGIIAVG